MAEDYAAFLARKAQAGAEGGFKPHWLPEAFFDFQADLTTWALRNGRSAIFADCGMGKTPMQLAWAENVVRETNGRVLILTPLAVGAQTVREGEKFGVDCRRSSDGSLPAKIVVTNYQRLHYFNPSDFVGLVCDESGILKSFEGATRAAITEFMRTLRYRSLWTATPAPNDYTELGTSSEALGHLGHMDMLGRFFKNDQNTIRPMLYRQRGQDFKVLAERDRWRLKGHAEVPFWRWVSSWARALRKPSDLGYDDGPFILPPLEIRQHVVAAKRNAAGMLFALPAIGLPAQREERRRTIAERCERMAALVVDTGQPAILWCHLNPEGDLLARLIPDAVQGSGADSDDAKEEKLLAFVDQRVRCLVIKPVIGAWGLNLQHCAHVLTFPSHSYEQWYQAIRRCWRFGQTRPVVVDVVTTEGEANVVVNLQRKEEAAARMFSRLVEEMNAAQSVARATGFAEKEIAPPWL